MRNLPHDTTFDAPRNAGFTLVELMIAMTLGLILIAGAIGVLSQFREGHRLLDGLSEVQENGRFAVQFVSRDVRMAGFPADSFGGAAIIGTNDDGGNGSDSITISFESGVDCLGNPVVGAPAVAINLYFIATNQLRCTGNGAGGATDVLVDEIQNMQVLYGEDLDGDSRPNRYVTSADVVDWNAVVSVKLALLARSQDIVVREPQDYFFDGVAYGSADRRVRRAFATTVMLRDRVL